MTHPHAYHWRLSIQASYLGIFKEEERLSNNKDEMAVVGIVELHCSITVAVIPLVVLDLNAQVD